MTTFVERLLHDAVHRDLISGESRPLEIRLHDCLDTAPLRERVPEALDRGRQPEVVERRRPELDGECTHILQRLDDLTADGALGAFRLLVIDSPP